MENKPKKIYLAPWIILLIIISFIIQCSKKASKDNSHEYSSEQLLQIKVDSLETALQECKDVRISIDFGHKATPEQAKAIYTDEEIRRLRKADIDHIYQTKGRYRTTNDEVFDQRVEDYIDDNYDEIIDKHRD